MPMLALKLGAVVLIITGGLLGGLWPLGIGLTDRGRRFMALGNAFAGGIFLGAGLIHLMSDSGENFSAWLAAVEFPFAALTCGAGFLLVLLTEKVMTRSGEAGVAVGGRKVYPYVLLLVLSIHSVIAGISLGLEQAAGASLALFIAIMAHKSTAAFALGVSLRKTDLPPARFKATILLFSLMTPLGILLGAFFTVFATGRHAVPAEAIFDGLAAGTFLYIAVLDIIEETFETGEDRLLKYLLVAFAFGFMALIAIWT